MGSFHHNRTVVLLVLLLFSLCSHCCLADNVTDTLNFLRTFAFQYPVALEKWTGDDYCNWPHVTCNGTSVALFLPRSVLDADGTLPDANSDDILVTSMFIAVTPNSGTATTTLPESWSRLKLLKELIMFDGVSGTLPASWGSLTALTDLRFYDTNLTGTLPAAWSGMSSLTLLRASKSRLYGSLPSDWTALTNLADLDVSHTMINGTLPAGWSAMKKLKVLDASNTTISGSLPAGWSVLPQLWYLNLSSSLISGTLPISWACFEPLGVLDMHNTSLGGPLPAQWGQSGALTKMYELYLGGNTFCGCEPDSWKSRSLLHNAVSSLSVALANCTDNNCTGYGTSSDAAETLQCLSGNQSGDGVHFGNAQAAVLVLLLTVTSLLL